ncbi:hypothetical protein [Endozoicomonas sp. ONNA1]|uniref:hypothetical protein n=1 Tax=Endozoicomonas sp. ONNA1 TaxID=2828740 RepID=UPI002147A530|nr:hypothetical protein [Endozoicomonas sp. ONNA1]
MNQYKIKYSIDIDTVHANDVELSFQKWGMDTIRWVSGKWIAECKPMPEDVLKTVHHGIACFSHLLNGREARGGAVFTFAFLADTIKENYSMDNPQTYETVQALMWCYQRGRGRPDCAVVS